MPTGPGLGQLKASHLDQPNDRITSNLVSAQQICQHLLSKYVSISDSANFNKRAATGASLK